MHIRFFFILAANMVLLAVTGNPSYAGDASHEITFDHPVEVLDIFGGYDHWPPQRISDDEVEILREITCVLETNKGIIRIELYPDYAPIHCANFARLIQSGYYDGLTFHRVIKDFMSQGGDPSGNGSGGPGYDLPAEINLPHVAGSVAAARLGDEINPDRLSSGSQFYMCHTTEGCEHLDGNYTVFGQVIEGQDVNLSLAVRPEGREGKLFDPDYIIRAWLEIERESGTVVLVSDDLNYRIDVK